MAFDSCNYVPFTPSWASHVVHWIDLCLYVLSTMGVSKESISKFLIGNRFQVKLHMLSSENCKKAYGWKVERLK